MPMSALGLAPEITWKHSSQFAVALYGMFPSRGPAPLAGLAGGQRLFLALGPGLGPQSAERDDFIYRRGGGGELTPSWTARG